MEVWGKVLVIFIQNGAILGNFIGYICLDIMPQKEDRGVQYIVIYIR